MVARRAVLLSFLPCWLVYDAGEQGRRKEKRRSRKKKVRFSIDLAMMVLDGDE